MPFSNATERRRNYEKGRRFQRESKHVWDKQEIALILSESHPHDRQLAKQLGVSVQAIQMKRFKIKRAKNWKAPWMK